MIEENLSIEYRQGVNQFTNELNNLGYTLTDKKDGIVRMQMLSRGLPMRIRIYERNFELLSVHATCREEDEYLALINEIGSMGGTVHDGN